MVAAITGWPEPEADNLWTVFSELDVPEGFRVELIGSEIVVNPPPARQHEHDLAQLISQVIRSSAEPVDFGGNVGLATPGGLFVPDSVFAPRGYFRDDSIPKYSAKGVVMVVETTSSRPETDREVKRLGYAAAGVPLYLLIDRSKKEVVLFAQPGDGDYRANTQVPFSSPLELPAPLSFPLDTTEFV